MKRIIFFIVIVAFATNYSFGQDTIKKSFIQKITGGLILVPQVDLASGDLSRMKVGLALLSNINFITAHTYHNVCYAWGGNALIMVNGWMYTKAKNQDIYLVLSKNFSKPGGNILIAWEHELTSGPIPSYAAIEVGTSWDKRDNLLVNLCLTIPFNLSLREKKWQWLYALWGSVLLPFFIGINWYCKFGLKTYLQFIYKIIWLSYFLFTPKTHEVRWKKYPSCHYVACWWL